MSELKAGVIVTPHDEGMCFNTDSDVITVTERETEFYLKSEADAVIAELKADYKEACDRLQTANLIKDEQLAATRHQKYKRCLDNAWYCKKLSLVYTLSAYTHRGWKIAREHDEKAELYRKWQKYWLKLSEKFKEAK